MEQCSATSVLREKKNLQNINRVNKHLNTKTKNQILYNFKYTTNYMSFIT